MNKEHHVIFVPGLKDQWVLNRNLVKLLPLIWKPQGFIPHIVAPQWEKGMTFESKLKVIVSEIDAFVGQGHTVSLVGQSAGGSAALNAYCERREVINGVVNATGRLRAGINVRPSLDWAAKHSPAFKESVLVFEHRNEPTLSSEDRRKIMTIRPCWDEIVPASTVPVEGAANFVAPVIEHSLGGAFTLSIFSPVVFGFLRSLEKRVS